MHVESQKFSRDNCLCNLEKNYVSLAKWNSSIRCCKCAMVTSSAEFAGIFYVKYKLFEIFLLATKAAQHLFWKKHNSKPYREEEEN